MHTRAPLAPLLIVALTSCAGGSAPAPSLGYSVPRPADASYVVVDTVTIALEGLGQSAEIGARSTARYSLHYDRSAQGVRVTATIEDLAADVVMPMASPISMDETAFAGDFVFDLDSRGRAVSMSSPQVSQLGGQVFAAPVLAHALFPRLAGRAVATGDGWADTVTYREEGEAGVTQVLSALTYTMCGNSEVDGRTVLAVDFAGSAEVTQDLTIEGARISQASEVEVTGHLHWDAGAGLLYESDMILEGPGTVRVALLPGAALPTRVRWRSVVRLQTRQD